MSRQLRWWTVSSPLTNQQRAYVKIFFLPRSESHCTWSSALWLIQIHCFESAAVECFLLTVLVLLNTISRGTNSGRQSHIFYFIIFFIFIFSFVSFSSLFLLYFPFFLTFLHLLLLSLTFLNFFSFFYFYIAYGKAFGSR
jgi:hypothetical protein